MKVALLSPVAPAASHQIGGTRSYTLGLKAALDACGDTTVLCGLQGARETGGITLIDAPTSSSASFLRAVAVNRRKLAGTNPDVVSVQLSQAAAALGNLRAPVVVTMHGAPYRGVSARRGKIAGQLMLWLEQIGLRRAAHVIFVDHESHADYVSRFGFLESKSSVVPVAVDTELFRPLPDADRSRVRQMLGVGDGAPLVAFVGRLSIEKNITELVRGFATLHAHETSARLVILGDGPERESAMHEAERLGAAQAVQILAGQSRQQIAETLAAADVLALPSRHEGLSIAAIEALCSGTPVLCTDVGRMADLVEPRSTGLLLATPAELGNALVEGFGLGTADRWIGKTRHACRERGLQYGWSTIVPRIRAIHTTVAGQCSGPA